MVPGQLSLSEREQNQRADCGLQKETPAALHSSCDQRDPCGESKQLQVPRCKHLRGPDISPFHTEIPENTRVMCSGICSRIVRFAAFTLPVIFRNMCVHSHTTRKDPVKTRDLSCDVYNARSPFH